MNLAFVASLLTTAAVITLEIVVIVRRELKLPPRRFLDFDSVATFGQMVTMSALATYLLAPGGTDKLLWLVGSQVIAFTCGRFVIEIMRESPSPQRG